MTKRLASNAESFSFLRFLHRHLQSVEDGGLSYGYKLDLQVNAFVDGVESIPILIGVITPHEVERGMWNAESACWPCSRSRKYSWPNFIADRDVKSHADDQNRNGWWHGNAHPQLNFERCGIEG
ncbi:MAG: hypothetical protein AAGD09_19700 [Cyanobacteria bacterium P01_F01_bin.56]